MHTHSLTPTHTPTHTHSHTHTHTQEGVGRLLLAAGSVVGEFKDDREAF
jgi:hypothetical protein